VIRRVLSVFGLRQRYQGARADFHPYQDDLLKHNKMLGFVIFPLTAPKGGNGSVLLH
jgi:hypothetical protein